MVAHPGMRFSVDPWDPSYGVNLDAAEGQSQQEVDATVELPTDLWRPLDPEPGATAPAATLFVDGVRRVDAQVWVDDPDGSAALPALCASYAAGVVCCCADGGAHLASHAIRRGFITTAPHAGDLVTNAGSYAATVVEAKPNRAPGQDLNLALQALLNKVEVEAAAQAREELGDVDDLLVVDGPLRGRDRLPRAIGYVKTHHTAYLEPAQNALVGALASGQRTPMFRLTSRGGWSRYSWYLRLPCAPGAPWAGIVRLECSAQLDVADAVSLARRSQVTLARYASAGYKDSRAPQNLYPIAGLERQLRRRLGDAGVLYRALRAAARPAESAARVVDSADRPAEQAVRLGDRAAPHTFDPAVAGLAG